MLPADEEYSKHNIAYLKKAIEQYLPTVKKDLNHEWRLKNDQRYDELEVTNKNIQYHYQRLPKNTAKSSNGSNLINFKKENNLGKVESSSKSWSGTKTPTKDTDNFLLSR